MRTLHLCGAGNSEGVRLALRVNEVEKRWDRIVLLDDDPSTHGTRLLDVEVLGGFDRLADADPARDQAVNLVARTTGGRRRAGARIASFGVPLTGMVAPGVDTLGADLAPDVLVYPGAIIGPEVTIGPGSVVFMGAVVGHESTVGPGCVVAANAVLNARVVLGEGVYVGSNATILPEIAVGAEATVGAGSTVVSPVPGGATVMGVPATVLMGPESRARTAGGELRTGRPVAPAVTAETVEAALVEAWATALEVTTVPPEAHVFELGATSLAALQVSDRLRRDLALDVAVVDLFRFATIRELARHLARSGTAPARSPSTPRRASAAIEEQLPAASTDVGVPDLDDLVGTITTIFQEVLGAPEAGPESHFFDLGGDPATAQEACGVLQRATGEPLCFMQVARYPTPRELARHLEASRGQPPHCPAQGVMNRLIHRHEWHRG